MDIHVFWPRANGKDWLNCGENGSGCRSKCTMPPSRGDFNSKMDALTKGDLEFDVMAVSFVNPARLPSHGNYALIDILFIATG